ncbi:MAG: helix-turn-helix transcriptional regulator [Alphaproteobacteria bacterium]|nr:helix-turn-helix transcriptional regulator [Alphaproteobacteria bacterium]
MPYDDYEVLLNTLEELSDIHDYQVAMNSDTESVPATLVDRLLKGDNPLKVWREHRNLTQQKIAQAADISIPFLCQLETGKRQPYLKTYQKLAKILQVSIDDLIQEEDK